MNCDSVRELIDAHALGATEPAERAAIDEHIGGCRDCARSFDEAVAVAGALALAVPLRAPPAELRARVIAAAAASPAGADGPQAAPARMSSVATQTRRSGAISPDAAPDSGRLLRYLGRAAVVGALAVGLGGLGVSGLMMDRVDDIESENSAMASDLAALRAAAAPSGTSAIGELSAEMGRQRTALAVLGASDTARLNLQAQPAVEGANASYYWTPAGATGVLLCTNLAPPPAGMEYRIWMRDERRDEGRRAAARRRRWHLHRRGASARRMAASRT